MKYCIFCKSDLDNSNRTIEHIIPKSIFKSNLLIIKDVCRKCNSAIGKRVEQPAIKFLQKNMSRMIMDGYNIQFGRRGARKKKVHLDKGISIFRTKKGDRFIPAEFSVNIEKKENQINLYPQRNENLHSSHKRFVVILPFKKYEGYNEILLLGTKIIFELCYSLWGDEFLECKDAKEMRNKIMISDYNENNTIRLEEDDPLVYELIEKEKMKSDPKKEKKSIFENEPNITFAVLPFPNGKWFSLLNLFGYEVTFTLFTLPKKILKTISHRGGFVIIIKTEKKRKIIRLTLNDYLRDKELKSPYIK